MHQYCPAVLTQPVPPRVNVLPPPLNRRRPSLNRRRPSRLLWSRPNPLELRPFREARDPRFLCFPARSVESIAPSMSASCEGRTHDEDHSGNEETVLLESGN